MTTMPPRIPMEDLIADTLAMMALIDRTEELADCLLWTGSTTSGGHPTYKPFGCKCTLVRRDVFRLGGGVLNPNVPLITTCGEKLCINVAHIKPSTPKKIGQAAAARGAWKNKDRSAKIAAAKRSQASAKLTIEIARDIRLSTESGPVLSKRHGVHLSVINGIKAGNRWKDYSSPWAGLMR